MAKVQDREMAVARVYARALLELAEKAGQGETMLADLELLAARLEGDRELAAYFASPLVDSGRRRELLEKAFRGRASDLLVDGLQVIARKGRLALLPAIAVAYRAEFEELHGIVDVEVRTAVALDATLRARLEKVVAKLSGLKPRLLETVDPDLLGGLIVQFGDQRFDASVETRLEGFTARIAARASEEIHREKSYWG